jgi:hypothetical protein
MTKRTNLFKKYLPVLVLHSWVGEANKLVFTPSPQGTMIWVFIVLTFCIPNYNTIKKGFVQRKHVQNLEEVIPILLIWVGVNRVEAPSCRRMIYKCKRRKWLEEGRHESRLTYGLLHDLFHMHSIRCCLFVCRTTQKKNSMICESMGNCGV